VPTIESDFTGTARSSAGSFESPATLESPQPFLCKLDYERERDQCFITHVHLDSCSRKEAAVSHLRVLGDPASDAIRVEGVDRGPSNITLPRDAAFVPSPSFPTFTPSPNPSIMENPWSTLVDDPCDDPWADEENSQQKGSPEGKSVILPLPEFFTDDPLATALSLAAQEHFPALGVLLERHSTNLFPHRFKILESIPEHASPSDYRQFLPAYDPSRESEQRWSSSLEQAGIESLPSRERIPGAVETPLSSSALLQWYRDQIDRIISRTGMVDTALVLTQHGASSGLSGLDEIGEDLSLLSRLVYDTPRPPTEDDDHTLSGWSKMSPPEVIRSYLSHSTPATIVKNIQRLVIPYLFVLESRAERSGNPDPSLRNRLLYEYIVNAPLEITAPIFEASKPILPTVERLIKDDEDLARIALALLYGSDSRDEWATMSRIFECMPAWDPGYVADASEKDEADTTIVSLGAFVAPSTTQPRATASDLLLFFQPLHASSLSRALDVLDVHLESGEIFLRWNVPARLRWFLQSVNDGNEQRSWAKRMARRAGGSSDEPDSPEEYEWLLEDMIKLSNTGESGLRSAFGLIPKDEVISIFLSGLLNSGSECVCSPDNRMELSPGHLPQSSKSLKPFSMHRTVKSR